MSMGDSVFLFNPWMSRPKYHEYGGIKSDGENSWDATRCGLVMYDTQTRYSAHLRRDQADLFATPCGKCFKAEATTTEDKT